MQRREGYGALFDIETRIGHLVENIAPGAFAGSLSDDVLQILQSLDSFAMPLPNALLPLSARPILDRLARKAAGSGNLDALFLLGEITRAEAVLDERVGRQI